MNSVESADFDVSALFDVCGQWPALKAPLSPAKDPLLERLRQVLVAIDRQSTTAYEYD